MLFHLKCFSNGNLKWLFNWPTGPTDTLIIMSDIIPAGRQRSVQFCVSVMFVLCWPVSLSVLSLLYYFLYCYQCVAAKWCAIWQQQYRYCLTIVSGDKPITPLHRTDVRWEKQMASSNDLFVQLWVWQTAMQLNVV